MPMDFPDMDHLKRTAEVHGFRQPYVTKPGDPVDITESEAEFREALADHVQPIDSIESGEIRFKVGWDRWTDEQKAKHKRNIGLTPL